MPNFSDNYTMHVLYNEDPIYRCPDESDGQETNPGKTVHISFRLSWWYWHGSGRLVQYISI